MLLILIPYQGNISNCISRSHLKKARILQSGRINLKTWIFYSLQHQKITKLIYKSIDLIFRGITLFNSLMGFRAAALIFLIIMQAIINVWVDNTLPKILKYCRAQNQNFSGYREAWNFTTLNKKGRENLFISIQFLSKSSLKRKKEKEISN